MKLLTINAKDLNTLIKLLRDGGYDIERGTHTVLLDHSEIEEFYIKKGGKTVAVMIAHYITPYYKAIVETEGKGDKEVIRALLRVKYSATKWYVPVNPVVVFVEDEHVIRVLQNYNDEYPCDDARQYVEHYKRKNPGYQQLFIEIVGSMLRRII